MSRILVVDDEANIRMTIGMALEQKKHTVEVASDGDEALALFGSGEKWDLVLLDHRMPGRQGLDVLQQMKERKPAQRIVMISAYGDYDLVQEAMESGAVDFLRKPFTAQTLRNVVKSALERPAPESPVQASTDGVVFETPIVDGKRIESRLGEGLRSGSATLYQFVVRSTEGEAHCCTACLPDYIVELVKARLDREEMPGAERFWQAFSEEAVAQYLWKNSEFPAEGCVRIDELTPHLQRWVSNTVKGLAEYKNAKK